jgi:PAS domain S-box-containing protein
MPSPSPLPAPDGFDWSRTPLGPEAGWSEALRAAVRAATGAVPAGTAPTAPAILDAIYTATPLGLSVWDTQFRFVRINDRLAEMNGLPPEAHIGRTPLEILPDIGGVEEVIARWREILRTGEPWLDVEVVGVTPAMPGRQRSWNEHFFPIREGGEIVGIGAVVEETTERRRIESALTASEARFREFAEASSDVLWLHNIDTAEFEYLSRSLRKIFQIDADTSDLPGSRTVAFSWLDAIVPEDREAARTALAQVRQGKRITHDFRARLPSGKVRWLKNTAFPLRDADGRVRRIGGIAQDVTEEREAAQRLEMLIAELQHRTRNLMGVVQALAESTLDTSGDLAEFRAAFSARIAALARVQALLSRLEGLERIPFDQLLLTELNAFGALPEDDPRVRIDGPCGIPLRSSGVQILALAVHELITNSIKYGALSQPDSSLAVTWHLLPPDGGERERLCVDWVERGVRMPPATEAARMGQGRELIERAVPYQLGATSSFALADDGVRCTIVLPVSNRLPQAEAA